MCENDLQPQSTRDFACTATMAALVSVLVSCSSRPVSGISRDAQADGPRDVPELAEAGPQDAQPQRRDSEDLADRENPSSRLEFVARRASYLLLGRVSEKRVDAFSISSEVGEDRWVIYYDEIVISEERKWGRYPADRAGLLILAPAHCELFRNGQLVPNAINSACTGRNSDNDVMIDQRVIAFACNSPGGFPAELCFKLTVSVSNTVDLTPVGESNTAAPLNDVLDRISRSL